MYTSHHNGDLEPIAAIIAIGSLYMILSVHPPGKYLSADTEY